MLIRSAVAADAAAVARISKLADERFRQIGMPQIAEDPTPPVSAVREHIAAGRVWVADDAEPVGFLAGDVVDGTAHVQQVSSVVTGRGVGARLLATFESWATAEGLVELTLTTFTDVPWNRPYYERLGWRVMPPARWGPGMTQVRAQEARDGLDAWPRCVMAKSVTQGELLV